MKKFIFSIASIVALAATVQAGTKAKTVIPPASEVGNFYVGVKGGLNVAQNNFVSFGDTKEKVGWAAGLNAGYMMGKAGDLVRPTIEVEALTTGFDRHFGLNNGITTGKARINSFAYMANGIANFNLGAFQPFIGAGAGYFSGKGHAAFSVPGAQFDYGRDQRDGFAFQLLGGVDYFVTPSVSVFTEYQWLNYVIRNRNGFLPNINNGFISGHALLGQHLVTAGVRYHF